MKIRKKGHSPSHETLAQRSNQSLFKVEFLTSYAEIQNWSIFNACFISLHNFQTD